MQPVTDAVLFGLAPFPLERFRGRRCRANGQWIELDELDPVDRESIAAAYAELASLERRGVEEITWPGAAALVRAVRRFGFASMLAHPSDRLAQVVHDVRGGAMAALVAELGRKAGTTDHERRRRTLALLARDHRTMMCAAIRGLDPSRRDEDASVGLHSVDRLVAAFRDAPSGGDAYPSVTVHAHFDGAISAEWSELGAFVRVLYNVLNNAQQHAADGAVHLWLLPIPEEHPLDVRVVVANVVAPAQASALGARFNGSLGRLLLEPFSTTGSGRGLKICSEIVAEAYGLGSREECVEGGYAGVRMVNDTFVTWFHWPLA